jgi:hypothetical protein
MDVTVTVYPEEGNFPAIAKALLKAADHPGQVVSVSHPRAGFIVPEHVFERFEAARPADPGQDEAVPEPRKRRPGRPPGRVRRTPDPTSDPSKEE